MEKRALGKGLSALIPSRDFSAALENLALSPSVDNAVVAVPLDEIRANRYQPRTEFNKEKLDELTSSIQAKGVVQPILVRKSEDGYELIAGERRLRASRALGLSTIPAIVREADDLSMLELSLIENIQREDLNPIEEAVAYQRLITEFSFTQEQVSQVLGKERSTVANMLRLLALPAKVQEYISSETISAGHGKAILGLASEQEQLRVTNLVVKKMLSVRETERLVAKRLAPAKEKVSVGDSNLAEIEDELRRAFGTRVKIMHGKKRGKIQIEYYSREDLERVLGLLRSRAAGASEAAASSAAH